jgi:hypothetical protein
VWLALQFHKRNKARIILPEWLSSKQLSGACTTALHECHTSAHPQGVRCMPAHAPYSPACSQLLPQPTMHITLCPHMLCRRQQQQS